MKRLLVGLTLAACALGAGVALMVRAPREPPPSAERPPAPAPRPSPAGPAELAVVAPLSPGNTLAEGWTVREIRAVNDGTFRVACAEEGGHGRVDLEIALRDDDGPTPPAMAGRFAIFYAARRAPPDDAVKLAAALAKVIEKNKEAAPPPGLTAFRPKVKPPEPL